MSEYINFEREYAKKAKLYCSEEDIDALSRVMNLTDIVGLCTHTLDNSCIEASYGETVHKFRSNGFQIIGFGPAPFKNNGRGIALIFEDCDTFQKYWCHITQRIFDWWNAQVK